MNFSGQSDLHIYFWPVATQFLKEGGWFGFLTSSSWLDVRYGFALQRWLLLNFEIVAIIESVQEPWFEDARVKTAVTILRRCSDPAKRDHNFVRFVRVKRPLAEILGKRDDEEQRQAAANDFRDLILRTKNDFSNDQLRIMIKKQSDLWRDGLSVAEMFARQRAVSGQVVTSETESEIGEEEETESKDTDNDTSQESHVVSTLPLDYGGGKWGRYLRAPDFYFEIMREFADRFRRLGDVATIKFGIKSGCDAFFMPRDVSRRMLERCDSELEWRMLPLMPHCERSEVESGAVAIIESGDRTLHPIERQFVRPEVHSLMQVDRPVVSPDQTDRVVLWVNQPLENIEGTYAERYIRWGAKQRFASEKSKAKLIPQRPTCKGRNPWYDLTGLQPGIGFWPKAQQYRHIVPANSYNLNCNCNLYDIHSLLPDSFATRALTPILNSTLVGLFKTFYGRYAGTEGNLKTEVIDVFLLEIPDPRNVDEEILEKLESALAEMQGREVTELLEPQLRDCTTTEDVLNAAELPLGLPEELERTDRRQLDDAVFELLGVSNPRRREDLVDRLYREMTLHTRAIRVVEVQKMEQRRHGVSTQKISQLDLALDAWQQLEPEWQRPLSDWLTENAPHAKIVDLPEGTVRLPDAGNFFEATTIYFGQKPAVSQVCATRAEAELLYAIAAQGLRGPISIPTTEENCVRLVTALENRLADARSRFEDLAAARAGTDELRERVVDFLHKWFVNGKEDITGNLPRSARPARVI